MKAYKLYLDEACECLLLNHEVVYKKKSDENTSLQGVILAANLQELFQRALKILKSKKVSLNSRLLVANMLPQLYLQILKIN
ncbi:MAG: hypothetical protein Q7S59_06925 [Sulfurimonas sp.]|nr:hypothetical protein [Sulfurimonas sp.]